jgi:hypothetical protein
MSNNVSASAIPMQAPAPRPKLYNPGSFVPSSFREHYLAQIHLSA